MSERLHEVKQLSAEEAAAIAQQYDLGEVLDLRLCSAGRINSNYELQTSKGNYLARVYAAHRQRENIEFELSILQHLSAQNFLCQRPIRAREGQHISKMGDQFFAVLTFLPGKTLEQSQLSEEVCHQIGRIYSHMQALLQGFVPNGAKPDGDYPLIQGLYADVCKEFRDKGESAENQSRFEALWAEISPQFRESERTVVHGDLYFENVLYDGKEITGIIDFDDAFLGSPLLDLALVVMEFATREDNELDFALVEAFLTSYSKDGVPIEVTAESLWNATRFQCFKFLGYTVELTVQKDQAPSENDYFRRLLYLTDPAIKQRFFDVVGRALERA